MAARRMSVCIWVEYHAAANGNLEATNDVGTDLHTYKTTIALRSAAATPIDPEMLFDPP